MNHSGKYLLFEEARDYVRDQNLENTRAWKKWSNGILEGKDRRPNFIPSNPDIVYRNDGWANWSDWIGSKKTKEDFLSFEAAKKIIRRASCKSPNPPLNLRLSEV